MIRSSETVGLDWAAPDARLHRVLGAILLLVSGVCVAVLSFGAVDLVRGRVSVRGFAVLAGFVAVVIGPELFAWRRPRTRALEVGRGILALAAAPAAYLFSSLPHAPPWPVFLVAAVATAPGLTLLDNGRWLGRGVVAAHGVLLLVLGFASGLAAQGLVLEAVAVVLAGVALTETTGELEQSLVAEAQKGEELASARSALLAEVEVAQEIQTLLFSEMEVAQRIQTLLLPKSPALPDHEVVGRMVTAAEVGGDYYDVLGESSDRALLAIGDVSGHGLTSGLTMMMVRTSLVGALEAIPDASLPRLYQVLNRCMRRNLERMDISMYMTFALLEYAGDGRFAAVGRHLPLLVWRRATGQVEEVHLEGMWLGVLDDLEDEHLPLSHFHLAEGDLLFLYTDGIVEQFAGEEMFGFDRLKDVVREHAARGPDDLIDEVLRRLGAFSPEQADDVTMLVVNHLGGVAAAAAS